MNAIPRGTSDVSLFPKWVLKVIMWLASLSQDTGDNGVAVRERPCLAMGSLYNGAYFTVYI